MHLTSGQIKVVHRLYIWTGAFTTREIADYLNLRSGNNEWSISRVSAILRRLKDRDIVLASKTRPTRYRLSPEARQAYGRDLNA
jgi:predicted transcriptional regulator